MFILRKSYIVRRKVYISMIQSNHNINVVNDVSRIKKMNHDNIVNSIPRVYVEKNKSARTGSDYYQLVIQFSDGYIYKSFLNSDQVRLDELSVKNSLNTQSSNSSSILGASAISNS